jgi:predicted TIM-barrel fold metal-dependent hydrolase
MVALDDVVDVDVHPLLDPERMPEFLPEPHRGRYLGGNRGPAHIGYWNPNGVRRRDAIMPDGREAANDPAALGERLLDAHGIRACVLNLDYAFFILSPDLDFAAAMSSAANDVLVHDWLDRDPRFHASVVVAPTDPALAAKEIRRVGDHPGFVQVLLPSGARMPYGNRFYHPIYEAAAETGLPLGIHTGFEGVGITGAPTASGYPTSYLEWHTGLFSNYVTHLISLVSEGVFQRFPNLRLVMIEGGVSWLPALMWRFDKNWKALRRLAPWLDRPPSEVIERHVSLTTQPLEEPERSAHLHQVLGMFDAARMLLFSSDFPHWDGDMPDFSAAALPPAMRRAVMSENARRLYRLRVPAA